MISIARRRQAGCLLVAASLAGCGGSGSESPSRLETTEDAAKALTVSALSEALRQYGTAIQPAASAERRASAKSGPIPAKDETTYDSPCAVSGSVSVTPEVNETIQSPLTTQTDFRVQRYQANECVYATVDELGLGNATGILYSNGPYLFATPVNPPASGSCGYDTCVEAEHSKAGDAVTAYRARYKILTGSGRYAILDTSARGVADHSYAYNDVGPLIILKQYSQNSDDGTLVFDDGSTLRFTKELGNATQPMVTLFTPNARASSGRFTVDGPGMFTADGCDIGEYELRTTTPVRIDSSGLPIAGNVEIKQDGKVATVRFLDEGRLRITSVDGETKTLDYDELQALAGRCSDYVFYF